MKQIVLGNSKNGIKISEGSHSSSWVIDQNMLNIALFNNSRTAWHTKILMSFLSFSENLLQNAYI